MGTTPAATASHAPTLSAAASVSSAFNCLVRLRLVAVGEPVTGAPSRRRLGRGGPLRWPQPAAAAWRCGSTGWCGSVGSSALYSVHLPAPAGSLERFTPGPVPLGDSDSPCVADKWRQCDLTGGAARLPQHSARLPHAEPMAGSLLLLHRHTMQPVSVCAL